MTSGSDTRSPIIRFLDNFFQEQNIKWMLGLGTVILLGSSLMLVISHWDQYTPLWQYAIMMGYAGLVFAAGEIAYWRLALRKTGTVLMSLTVLLLPMTFLALNWIRNDGDTFSLASLAATLSLIGPSTLFSWFAARRIFSHFLRGSQPTFLASYLILCLAGAIAPALPTAWSPVVSLFLWSVFAIGTIKVNRYVFWLTEEHRLPRIFGFFPIALLGTQFLSLFAVNFAGHLQLQWLGLASVLIAFPVLLTADTVARVFQQRTGDLVRPLPWSIMLPMLIGLALCATGICLAFTGMPRPFALVPTAAIAAVIMAATAHRTQNSAFIWAMFGGILLAYNFAPVFFLELARRAIQTGATAVNESKLPYAFYGLTYLPLLSVLILAAAQLARRGNDLFAIPLRKFATAIAVLLFAVSFTHDKALFPVSVVMTAVFGIQTFVFRKRLLIVPAIAALIAAGFGFVSFGEEVLGLSLGNDSRIFSLVVVAGLLFVAGRLLDRLIARLPDTGQLSENQSSRWRLPDQVCQNSSFVLTLIMCASWVGRLAFEWDAHITWLTAIVLTLLLMMHAIIQLKRGLGELAIVFAMINVLCFAAACQIGYAAVASMGTLLLLALWLSQYLFRRLPQSRVTLAFARPAYHVSLVGLTCVIVVFWLPQVAFVSTEFAGLLLWGCPVWLTLWAFDAARRVPHGMFAVLGCIGVLTLVRSATTFVISDGNVWEWLPAAWAATAAAMTPVAIQMRRRLDRLAGESEFDGRPDARLASRSAIASPVNWMVLIVLSTVAAVSLLIFTTQFRIAGAVALAGLLVLGVAQPLVDYSERRKRRSALKVRSTVQNNHAVRAHAERDCCEPIFGLSAPNHKLSIESIQPSVAQRHSTIRQIATIMINWQLICLAVQVFAPDVQFLFQLNFDTVVLLALPVAFLASVSVAVFQHLRFENKELVVIHVAMLRFITVGLLLAATGGITGDLEVFQILLAIGSFVILIACELHAAVRDQVQQRVWMSEILVVAAVGFLVWFHVIPTGHGISMFAVLAAGISYWIVARIANRGPRSRILTRPFELTGMALPLAVVVMGVVRHFTIADPSWLGLNSLALLLAAGFYFCRGIEHREKKQLVLSAVILNIALTLLWRELSWWDPQFFMIPLGISILSLVQLLKREIPERMHQPLYYVGALTILVSPTFHIVGGSWLHLFTLMLVSVTVTLLSIGLRVRPLMYAGTGFLLADLIAMLVCSSIEHSNLLWFAGIGLGTAVIVLAAICENHRETVLQRLRLLAAELETWE